MAKNKEITKVPDKAMEDRFSIKVDDQNRVRCNIDEKLLRVSTGFQHQCGGGSIVLNNSIEALLTGGCSPEEMKQKVEQLFVIMAELKPRNGFEGMLISQMVTVYNQVMDCFKYVNLNYSNPEACQRLQNQAIKLMRLYNQQLEALDKHRNKGKQKMTVEHVHVHKGGQAIVGSVNQGGETKNER